MQALESPSSTAVDTLIIAIDPGITTGVARFRGSVLEGVGAIRHEQYLFGLIRSLPIGAVVLCEDFNAIRLTTAARSTLKLIGKIEYATQITIAHPPLYQTPQQRRAFIPIARSLLGLRTPSGERWMQHHIDAVAHGLYYLHRTYPSIVATSYQLREDIEVNEMSPSN